jgi:hypothetical protein
MGRDLPSFKYKRRVPSCFLQLWLKLSRCMGLAVLVSLVINSLSSHQLEQNSAAQRSCVVFSSAQKFTH